MPEPLLNHRRVDAAEVGSHLQVTVVQIRQAGVLAVESALDAAANDEHRGGGSVVGAEAGVLFDAASELGEHHDGDVVGPADTFQVFDEATDRIGGIGQQTGVRVGLVHVGIERVALVADVVEPGWHVGVDEGGHAPQIP